MSEKKCPFFDTTCKQVECMFYGTSECIIVTNIPKLSNIENLISNLQDIIKHEHDKHSHLVYGHNVTDLSSLNVDDNKPNFIKTDSPVLILLQEYMTNTDMDGNNKIYGKDFYISDPPEMLKSLTIKKHGLNKMTITEYLSEIGFI